MNFYRRRPLTLAISLCLLVSAAMAFVPGILKLILILLTAVAVPTAVIILHRRGICEVFNLSVTGFVCLCGGLVLCVLLTSFGYYDVYVKRFEPLEGGTLQGVVTEVRNQTPYSALYVIKSEELDGEPLSGKGLIYTEESLSASEGDVIKVKVEFVPTDEFYGDYRVSRLDMLTDGYVFSCNAVGAAEICGTKMNMSVWFANLRSRLSAELGLVLNGESSAMADALLLGDRDGLGCVRRDFSELGVMHILALSGMHIAVLVGGADRILRMLGLGRRIRYPMLMLFMAFYAGLTGFLLSVVRASLMMAVTFIADMFDEKSDRITALFAAVGVIVLFDPVSVWDVSLQLSFLATLGMTLMSESGVIWNGHIKGVMKPFARLLSNAAISAGALIFVLPLQWLYFGRVSAVCIPATMIISVLCEGILLLLPLQLVFTLLGWHFMCGRLGFLIELLTRITSEFAEMLAEAVPAISLEYPFVPLLLVCFLASIIYMVSRNVDSWLYSLIPAVICAAVFVGGMAVYDNVHETDAEIFYSADDNSDCLAVLSRRKALVIDVTGGASYPVSAVWEDVSGCGIASVDSYLLTDLTRKHIGSVRRFIRYTRVNNICAPLPEDEYELYLADDLREVAEEYGAVLTFYKRNDDVLMQFGDVTVSIPERTYIGRSKVPLETVTLSRADAEVTYVGAAVWESTELWTDCLSSDVLVFGRSGPIIYDPPLLEDCREGQPVHIPDLEYSVRDGVQLCSEADLSVGRSFRVALDGAE